MNLHWIIRAAIASPLCSKPLRRRKGVQGTARSGDAGGRAHVFRPARYRLDRTALRLKMELRLPGHPVLAVDQGTAQAAENGFGPDIDDGSAWFHAAPPPRILHCNNPRPRRRTASIAFRPPASSNPLGRHI